jgi:hypothetical protein
MTKKRKLNSNNPRYKKLKKEDEIKVERKFIKEVKGVKIYAVKYLT